MVIKETTWTSDTCACSHSYTWDDSVPQGNRTHTYSKTDVLCTFHELVGTGVTAFNTALDENNRKNINLQTMIDNAAAQLSSTGSAGGTLKDGITYTFTFTGTAPNRVLNVSFGGITLTGAQKNALQNAANSKFGAGKVVIS